MAEKKAKKRFPPPAGSQTNLFGADESGDAAAAANRERGIIAISQADERAIMAAADGQMASEFVYRYQQGNQTVTGISYPGFLKIFETVYKAPLPEFLEGPTIELVRDDPRGPTLVASCVVAHPKNKKVRVPAYAEQSVFLNPNDGSKRGNYHARAVVLGKLIRNAIKGIIPMDKAAQFLAKCLNTKAMLELKQGEGGGGNGGGGRRTRLALLFSMAQSNGVDVNKDAGKKKFLAFIEAQFKRRLSDCSEEQLAAMARWLDENIKRHGKEAFQSAVEAAKTS